MTSHDLISESNQLLKGYDVNFANLARKLAAAIDSDDLLDMSRIASLMELLLAIDYKDVKDMLRRNPELLEEYQVQRSYWESRLSAWKESLKEGDQFDNYHDKDKKWYRVKLIERNGDNVLIHYQGWASKFDRRISLTNSNSFPSEYRVPNKVKSLRNQGKMNVSFESNGNAEIAVPDEELNHNEEPAKSNGRTRSKRNDNRFVTANAAKKPRKADDPDKDKNEWICAVCDLFENFDESALILCDGPCMRSFHVTCLGSEYESDKAGDGSKWFCGDCLKKEHCCFVCKKRGLDGKEVFKCHTASCGKYYHHYCLEIGSESFIVPPQIKKARKQLESMLEDEVQQKQNIFMSELAPVTASIEETSTSSVITTPKKIENISSEARVNIDVSLSRGKRHRSAPKYLSDSIVDESIQEIINSPDSPMSCNHDDMIDDESERVVETPMDFTISAVLGDINFKCSYHYCDTCFEHYGDSKSPLFKCIRCPRSFHINCIPPGSRFNALCLLCPLHPNENLPSNAKPTSANPITNMYGWLWDQMPLPDTTPIADNILENHYRLSTSVREDVNSQPTDFKMLIRNDYESLPNKRKSMPYYEPEDHCSCTAVCDEDCMNRILNVECCDNIASSTTNFKSNCNIYNQLVATGEQMGRSFNCGNRQLQYREYAQYEKFRELNRGFGLRAVQDVPDGSLVIEYVGEVIDEEQMIERMTNQRKHSPNDHDFYIMQLDTGFYVDGKIRGNYSRFINHSCDPNCELQRWVVQGTMRIGIFAIKDIKAGDALSYDYQFDTREDNIFKCYCESSNCRGTMAPAKKSNQIVNQFVDRMQRKLLRFPGQVDQCVPCSWSEGISLKRMTIDEQKLAELLPRDRRKLIEYGRNEELKRIRDNQTAIQQLHRSYVGKLLPGDGVNEVRDLWCSRMSVNSLMWSQIRGGPVRSTFAGGKLSHLFLVRSIKKGANLLYRRRLKVLSASKQGS